MAGNASTVAAVLAGVTLALAGLVHVATFFTDPWSWPVPIIPLHVLALAAFGLAVWSRKSMQLDRPAGPLEMIPPFTSPLFVVTVALMAYVTFNFGSSGRQIEDGNAEQLRDGTFAILNHGHMVREVTASAFHQHRAVELRLWSGHWVLFSAIALAITASNRKCEAGRATGEGPTSGPN